MMRCYYLLFIIYCAQQRQCTRVFLKYEYLFSGNDGCSAPPTKSQNIYLTTPSGVLYSAHLLTFWNKGARGLSHTLINIPQL